MDSSKSKNKDYHEAIKNVVEHLKSKRNELLNEINNDEVEKARVLGEMDKLKDRLSIIEANLKKKSDFRKDYDKAISQSEGHFIELMQKSEDFLNRARREAMALSQAIGEKTCPENKPPERPKEVKTVEDPCKQVNDPCASPPAALVTLTASDPVNCINCSNTFGCTTITVPFRANGL